MSINGGTVKPDATTFVVPTGGASAVALIAGYAKSLGKVVAHLTGESDFLTRTSIEFSVKDPVAQVSAPGGYTQIRQTVFIKVPMTLANGNRTVNTLSITMSRDPEFDATDTMSLRLLGCQALGDADLDEFFTVNNLA